MGIRFAAAGAIASFATLVAAPSALAEPSGFVSLSGAPNSWGFSYMGTEEAFDGMAVEALASGVYMFTPVLGAQGDVLLGSSTLNDDIGDITTTSIDGALHGFYREADKFLVGGFIQFGRDSVAFDGVEAGEIDRAYIGGEAQVFVENLTLYGQAGMQQYQSNGGLDFGMDGWFGSLEARYFLTPDLRIEARVGLSTLDLGLLDISATTLTAGVGAEYRFDTLPVSVFARYDFAQTSYDFDPSPAIDSHRVTVGARFGIGEDSLLDRDRNGASLKPVQFNVGVGGSGIFP